MNRFGRIAAALAAALAASIAASAHAALPLVFEKADGSGSSPTAFVARGAAHSLLILGRSSELLLHGEKPVAVRSSLLGARPTATPEGLDAIAGGTSRFLGSDPSKWVRSAPTFRRVRTAGVYPGIDMVWHGRDGTLEYDFVVAPAADPGLIAIEIDGAKVVAIDGGGDLVLDANGRLLRWRKPVSFQQHEGTRTEVASSFRRLGESRVGFQLGAYDRTLPLVIDPVLAYATYVAPTSFAAGDGVQNHGLAVVTDEDGNAYVAGVTQSASFPVTGGAFDTTRPGNTDLFVAKLSPDGEDLLWATYLGGTQAEVDNHRTADIAIDELGNVYVTSSTKSTDFPTTGAIDTTLGGTTDAVALKLTPDGAALVYSTYLGGDGIDRGWGIAVDAFGRAIIGGETNDDFPTTPGAYQADNIAGSAFACRLTDDGSALEWSTTIGKAIGVAHDMAIDSEGNVYLTGRATPGNGTTTGYPVTEGAYQTVVRGSTDAFVTKLKHDGTALVWSTFLGGDSQDEGRAVTVDADGKVYVFGATSSTNFPATPGAFQTTFQSTPTPQADGFVAGLAADGSALVFATYLGGAGLEDPLDIVVDGDGNPLVVGATYSNNFPTTEDALQEDFTPGPVFFSAHLSKVSPSGGLLYSTLLHPVIEFPGGTSFAYGVALDASGAAYVTGTSTSNYPTTPGAFQANILFGTAGPFVTKIDGVSGAAEPVCGDFSGDGEVTASDALGVLKFAVGLGGACPLVVCDFDGNGQVSANDALGTLRIAVRQMVVPDCPLS